MVYQMLQNSTKYFYAFKEIIILIQRIIYIFNEITICIFNLITVQIFNEIIIFIQPNSH